MNGKRARQLRRLALKENKEKDEVQEIIIKRKFIDRDGKEAIVDFKTVRNLGVMRLYRGLKKWRQTKKGIISRDHS